MSHAFCFNTANIDS